MNEQVEALYQFMYFLLTEFPPLLLQPPFMFPFGLLLLGMVVNLISRLKHI